MTIHGLYFYFERIFHITTKTQTKPWMVRANKNWEIIPYFCFFFANSSSTVIRFNTMFSIFPYCHVVITENKNQQNRYQLWCLNPFFSKMRTKSFYSDWLITTDINIWCWTTVFRLDFSFKVKSTDRLNFNIKIRPWVRPPNYAIFYLKTIQVCCIPHAWITLIEWWSCQNITYPYPVPFWPGFV